MNWVDPEGLDGLRLCDRTVRIPVLRELDFNHAYLWWEGEGVSYGTGGYDSENGPKVDSCTEVIEGTVGKEEEIIKKLKQIDETTPWLSADCHDQAGLALRAGGVNDPPRSPNRRWGSPETNRIIEGMKP